MEGDWWKDKIAEDIYETFRIKEQMIPHYHAHSPQLWSRRCLVDWIAVIVENFGLQPSSQHLAVYLLDYFLDKLEVNKNHLYLLAIACLVISVKFEEHCDRIPCLSSVNTFLPQNNISCCNWYSKDELLSMELTVLNYFDWVLSVPTVPHFLPYFLNVAVDETDMHNGFAIKCKSTMISYVEKYAKYFQEISLQDHLFRDYTPSMVAAACIAAARIYLQLTPTWPKQLELMTDYYLEELLPCVHMMTRIHRQDERNKTLMVTQSPVQYNTVSPVTYPVYNASSVSTICVYKQPETVIYDNYTSNYITPVVFTDRPPPLVGYCRGS